MLSIIHLGANSKSMDIPQFVCLYKMIYPFYITLHKGQQQREAPGAENRATPLELPDCLFRMYLEISFLLILLLHGGFGCVFLYTLNPVFAAVHGFIAFGGCDNLAVFRLQSESELPGLILINLKLRML